MPTCGNHDVYTYLHKIDFFNSIISIYRVTVIPYLLQSIHFSFGKATKENDIDVAINADPVLISTTIPKGKPS